MINSWKKYLENNQNINSSLKEKFWEDVNFWIKKEIWDLQIDWLKNINSILWWSFFNSCFHPDEFWIWSYRVSSLVNQSEISDWIWIKSENIFVDYLDTITSWWVKWFPNIKLSNNFWWKMLFSEILEKWNSIQNLSAKEKIEIWNKIFDEFLKISQFDKNIFSSKVLIFFEWILWEIWLDKKFSEWVENFSDKEKNLKNKIISFLFREKILEKSHEIKNFFLRNLMQKKYLNWFSKSEFYWEYQNAILSIFINENFWEKKEILERKNILNNWKINFENSYNNEKNVEKFWQSIESILEDENLWEEFFYSFFDELLKNSWWRPVKIMDFEEDWVKKDLFIYKEKLEKWENNEDFEFVFYKWKLKNPEKIKNSKWFWILKWEDFWKYIWENSWEKKWIKNYNLSWNITIFLMWTAWSLHIWSERWYRKITAKSVEDFFEKKEKNTESIKNYVKNIILWLWIFDTFDEKWNNEWKNLAGSIWSLPWDIFKMSILWWEFAKGQVENFLKDNSKIPEFDEKSFINSFCWIFNNIENRLNSIKWIKISDELDKIFLEKKNIFDKNQNFENFLDLLFYSYKLDKILR